jgi:hypothetical protein
LCFLGLTRGAPGTPFLILSLRDLSCATSLLFSSARPSRRVVAALAVAVEADAVSADGMVCKQRAMSDEVYVSGIGARTSQRKERRGTGEESQG